MRTTKAQLDETSRHRVRLIAILMSLFMILILGRLFFLQIVHGAYYKSQAEELYGAAPTELFDRGSVYFLDRHGAKVAAASLRTGYILAMKPADIIDPNSSYDKLSEIIEVDKADFLAKTAKTDDPYEEIARRVSLEKADEIRALGISGIQLFKERWRNYPGNDLAAHVLGFVGWQGDEYKGRYGIERHYDKVLERSDEHADTNFFVEIFDGINESVFKRDSSFAGDVVLTIEPHVQAFAESRLEEARGTWSAKEAGVIVIKPDTGEIVAMAASPSFSPGSYGEAVGNHVYSNPLVEKVYEMGSIMKPITLAAAFDAGVASPGTFYQDDGFVEVDGHKIHNHDGKGRGYVDMQEVINNSLNTGSVYVATLLGRNKHRSYIERFGLTEKTGIDLPGEAQNLTNNLSSNRSVEFATLSFGQGVAVSPVSMTRALSVLANGGYLIKPYITHSLEYDFGANKESTPTELGRVISPEASEEITRMLVTAVDDALRGGNFKNDNYSIAGKTGTAQIAAPGGGYYDDRFLHSFFGYFPAFDPEFLIFVYLREPVGVRYASDSLTEAFMDTVDFLASYYEVAPDRHESTN